MTFDEWLDIRNASGVVASFELRERENLQVIWDAATAVERDRCKEKCRKLASDQNLGCDDEPPYKEHEDTYLNGWLDACNECTRVISGCLPRSVVFTQEELSKVASIGKAYFEQNRPK